MITINTRADLDSLIGTDEHTRFMKKLRGSLFAIRKDDALGKWVADESNELIEKFGFTRADFTDIQQPILPEYNPSKTLKSQTSLANSECTRRIYEHWDLVGQINVLRNDSTYTTAQKASCNKWIDDNKAALVAIMARTDILTIDVTDDQYWPVYPA